MTKLEKEIMAAMWNKGESLEDEVKAAAEVAKKYIEKAFNDATKKAIYMCNKGYGVVDSNEWLKENGVI